MSWQTFAELGWIIKQISNGRGKKNNVRAARGAYFGIRQSWPCGWSFSYIEEPPSDGSMRRRRCGVRNHEDEHPTIFTSILSQRSRQRRGARRGEGSPRLSLSSPLLSSLVLFYLPQFQCTSSWSAEYYAPHTEPLWFTSRAFTNQPADPLEVPERSCSVDGLRRIQTRVHQVSDLSRIQGGIPIAVPDHLKNCSIQKTR